MFSAIFAGNWPNFDGIFCKKLSNINRLRVFVQALLRLGWIIGALLVFGGQVVLLLNLFLRSKAPHAVKGSVDVGPANRFAVGSTTHFWKEGFLLVHHQRGFLALSHQCTHNKCRVDYVPDRRVILCPCHGSQFSPTGAVLTGPARLPLTRYPTAVRNGRVVVELPS